MISIYSLRAVYTFLYTIMNGNVIASFVKNKKCFEILWSKKFFFAYVRNLQPFPLPPCTQSYAFGLTSTFPLCTYVICGWPLIYPLKKAGKPKFFSYFQSVKKTAGQYVLTVNLNKANEAFSGTKCHSGHKICSGKLERLLSILILLENNFLLPSFGHSFIDEFSRL